MKWKIVLLSLVFFSLVSTVYSISCNDLLAYYEMDDTTDSHASYDLTEVNSPTHATGKVNNGYNCSANNYLHAGSIPLNLTSATYNLWVKRRAGFGANDWTGMIHRIDTGDGSKPQPVDIYHQGSDEKFYLYYGDTFDSANGAFSIGFDWHMYTVRINGTAMTVWVDGVLKGSGTQSGALVDDTAINLQICQRQDNVVGAEAIVDELSIWDRPLTATEIEELNDSITYSDLGCGATSATLTINHNLANTINYNETSSVFTYNGTYSDTGDLFNCSIYVDTVLNQTDLNANLSVLQDFTVTWGTIEHNFSVYITCANADVSDTTSTYYYAVDTIEPTISITTPSNFNGTSYVEDTNLQVSFNFSDNNLDGYNVTWYDSDGTTVLQSYSAIGLTGTSYTNTSTRKLSDTGSNFSIVAEAWDSHNPLITPVRPLQWYSSGQNIFAEDFTFTGDFKEDLSYFYLSENKYKMKLTFNEDKTSHELTVSAIGNLRYIQDSEYIGHFVYLPKKRYIDFEGSNVESVDVVECEQGYCLTINLFEPSDEIELESIGDLNYVSQTYYYNVYAQSDVYLESIDESLENITEVLEMIPIIALYIFFTILGFILIYVWKQKLVGITFLVLTIPFDFYFVQYFYEEIISTNVVSTWQTGFIGLFGIGLFIWIFLKMFMPFLLTTKKAGY